VSEAAAAGGLATTLFERMHRMHGHAAAMLTTQYRMHESIMAWSSAALYGGRLRAHESVACHTLAGLAAAAADADADVDADALAAPLMLVDTAGCSAEEAQEEEGGSWFNAREACAAVAVVMQLRAAGLPPSAIGVITPYSAQKARCALACCTCVLVPPC
jgi:ATP-dependent RNA/DNA helicase IGHMBP2